MQYWGRKESDLREIKSDNKNVNIKTDILHMMKILLRKNKYD